MNSILLVEDNVGIVKGLSYLLESEGFSFKSASCVNDAKDLLENNSFDLAILDLTLPDGDGYSLCSYIKERYNTFVIILTAKDEEKDVVQGFDSGADDYVIKPFRNRELVSRINYFLKKNKNSNLVIQNVRIDTIANRIFVDDTEVVLTSLEYKILLLLFQNANRIITRELLLDRIWDQSENFVNDNTLTVYIKRIREKLGVDIIKTVKGIGYRVDKWKH